MLSLHTFLDTIEVRTFSYMMSDCWYRIFIRLHT